MKSITIDTNKGPATIPAYIHGKFAVHLPYYPMQNFDDRDPEHFFHITHIATGLKVTSIYGRPSARAVARTIDAAITHDITKQDYEKHTDDWYRFKAAMTTIVKRD